MSCYLTALSVSNIYCRPPLPAVISPSQPFCHPSFQYPPICQARTQHCNYSQGGGCCPVGTSCTQEGCTGVIEFVFPSMEPDATSSTAAAVSTSPFCEVDGCRDVPELVEPSILPTSSTISDAGVTTATATSLEPATWTVTVTGSKTGEVCDPSAVPTTTTGVPSGTARGICVPGSGFFVSSSVSSFLVVALLVLAVEVLF